MNLVEKKKTTKYCSRMSRVSKLSKNVHVSDIMLNFEPSAFYYIETKVNKTAVQVSKIVTRVTPFICPP
jgi:hypothetical protein